MRTPRLSLAPPASAGPAARDDLAGLHAVYRDAATWRHFPSGRFADVAQTERLLNRWRASWAEHGLGPWVVRRHDDARVIGSAGVSAFFGGAGPFWNLGYRFAVDVHGQGYAAEACVPALTEARRLRPEVPVVASLLEHNTASARLAERLGLQRVHRGPDVGNPDPGAVRLVYADRPLEAAVVLAIVR